MMQFAHLLSSGSEHTLSCQSGAIVFRTRVKEPLVSVIVRTYNEQKWVAETLKQLFKGTFKNFEVIIIDSGSTDQTLKIVKQFPIAKISKIKKSNYTPGYSLNKGINQAQGKFICILSAHSVPTGKNFLDIGVKAIKSDPRLCGIDGYYSALPDGSFWEKRRIFTYFWAYLLNLPDPRHYNTLDNTHSIIKKSCWQLYPFDEKLESCEDYDWAQEMISRGFKVKRVPRFFCFHSHGLNRKQEQARQDEWAQIKTKIDKKIRPKNSQFQP